MPYVQLNTSVKLSDTEKHQLCDELGELMPLLPTKSRENTMMNIVDGCYIEFGTVNQTGPALNLEVRLFGVSPEEDKNAFVGAVSALFETRLGVPINRMYINLTEYNTWGSKGQLNKK
ncbi:MAG: hypothetical protein LBN22_03770 [Clostridiales Family XIII bacterium]|jgi:phenylpyruvate tautomerase PptA (4-oxalocrotonate tautomerase family)|nr:hypothetical protein [Clostridiales Family XIII bacterium]